MLVDAAVLEAKSRMASLTIRRRVCSTDAARARMS
jgi:hypothetical protein